MPKISIVIPVYNNEPDIGECLGSVLSQTLSDIEIICVDDCSVDGSAAILADHADRDSRLRVITQSQNMSASQARKDGVLSATGDYVMFVDADDTIERDACERLYSNMLRDPVDILHFGATVVNENNLPASRIRRLQEFLSPFPGKLVGEEIIRGAFSEPRVYNFTLWDKLYSSELCLGAFARVKDGRFPMAEDTYAYFVLSYYALSYRGVPNIKAYNYHFGRGFTGRTVLTMSGFERNCAMVRAADAIDEFLEEEGLTQEFAQQSESLRRELLAGCLGSWMRHIGRDDASPAFDRLVEAWGVPHVVSALAFLNRGGPGVCARRVRDARSLASVGRPVRTVATYYHSYSNGGVERVLSLLTGLWRDMGYDVVLLTDEPPSPDDYELPEGVRRVVIPACRVLTRDSYLERAQALVIALRENEVDALVFHAWASPLMLWDLLVCKLSGVSFFVHCHGIFSQLARKATPYFADMPAVYALADGVITLGEVDRAYWSFFNTSVTAVLNPLSFEPAQTQRASLADKTILWLGRLSDEKRPEDALKIFAKVLEREPEARMEMVGSSSDDKYLRRLQKLARALGVEDAVSMHGFHREVMPFYARAAVLLMTSEYEGFGMVLTESQSLGLPCVMYELPYLTAVRTGRGIVPVEMGDIDSAADAVADILADREYRLKLGRDARANAEELATFDYHGAWRGVFEGSSSARGDLDPDIVSVMWETLHGHYRIGARARSTEVAKLKDEIAFGVGPAGLIRRMRRGLRRKWKRLLRPKS